MPDSSCFFCPSPTCLAVTRGQPAQRLPWPAPRFPGALLADQLSRSRLKDRHEQTTLGGGQAITDRCLAVPDCLPPGPASRGWSAMVQLVHPQYPITARSAPITPFQIAASPPSHSRLWQGPATAGRRSAWPAQPWRCFERAITPHNFRGAGSLDRNAAMRNCGRRSQPAACAVDQLELTAGAGPGERLECRSGNCRKVP